MEYTVQKLGQLAGISTRTLRYYDEINLLTPARTNSSGYRIYGSQEVNRLQQILFYRELGISLNEIKDILQNPSFDEMDALIDHQQKLLKKRKQLDLLILNVEKTIASKNGGMKMSNKDKFEGFKQNLIDENEKKYGCEVREKYGDDVVEKSNTKVKGMSEADHTAVTALGEEILVLLYDIMDVEDPSSEKAQVLAAMHRKWLMFYWPSYSREAHAGLAQMYVADERFTAFYDKRKPGAAKFLKEAILVYTQIK
ncbi:MAG: MerR family transcriptional regulator [Turicibacter sp.]